MFARIALKLRPMTMLALVAAIALAAPEFAAACPSCKAAIASQEGQGDLVSGFFWSILSMMSMPFAMIGSFSGYMFLAVRKARAEQAKKDQASQNDGGERHVS